MHYIKLLEKFLQSGLETVLFLEDDADFDIHIRQQFHLFATALRSSQQPPAANLSFKRFPYGDDTWDILWVGHKGMEFAASSRVGKIQ